ncbi:MAG: hypothetical protein PWP65_1650 [Clostridia bacterium]|nr:hypothetical protein [Clostridia bacterium]
MGKKPENRLNDLSGREWLYWTDTLYITAYPVDATHPLRKQHGAMKPPEVMAEIVRFFTKKGEMVLDPFAGVGGTLLGAELEERQALGFEINPRWVEIYATICRNFAICEGQIRPLKEIAGQAYRRISAPMYQGDCLKLLKELPPASVDAIITDPPYGCDHGATGFADETNFNMQGQVPDPWADLGNAPDLAAFLTGMASVGRELHRVLKPGRYLVMMVGDRYRQGEYLPLGYILANCMREVGFKLKGVKIWSNKATRRRLKPYAVYSVFVPNITHQNILILRKE